ncbi:PDZ/DHR/GLGF domain protein [Ancylostoma ceylanicum]|uniref:PDZ/DHR/GLGF domain protein n=1 Tax=Ancylostoma ceylanicum TaxID=53326 RepID=A0A0D6LB82_9BILA|nr:PDZ/DHR/GLGF domain protein [Ancylostoma ceylanicum]
MSYETISVRMNRSDPSIRWGFTLRQQGNRIVVATVDRDSLSDKAGMKSGDEVDTVCGRNAVNMSVNEANSIVDSSYQEVHFNLRRYVTTHTCLPWTLTEKDNKLIVDDMQPGYGSGFGEPWIRFPQSFYCSSHEIFMGHIQPAKEYNCTLSVKLSKQLLNA